MRVMAAWFLGFAAVGVGMAQTPATSPPPKDVPATTQSAPPSTLPKNLDKALDDTIILNATNARLEDAIATLRQITQTNIAVNWAALELAGITRDTPVTLHVSNVTYEQALRALLEQLPAKKTRPNYMVGENTLEITTTAELGKQTVVRVYPIKALLTLSLTGEVSAEQHAAHVEFVKKLVHDQLVLAGEDVDGAGRTLVIEDDVLAATQSRRAQAYVQNAIHLLAAPVRQGERAPGTQISVQEKKAQDRMTEICGKGDLTKALAAIIADPAKAAPGVNVVELPGAKGEPGKPVALDYFITDGGVVFIGSDTEIQGRVILAAYDIRDLVKRMAFRSKQKPPPTPEELADSVITQLKAKVLPLRAGKGEWGELEKSPNSITRYEGFVVVSASAAAHRAITAALQELYR